MADLTNKSGGVKIVLGTALFGDASDPQTKFRTREDAKKVLDIFRARGYNQIDTARGYPVGAPGTSEKLLGSLNDGDWMRLDSKVVSWTPGSHLNGPIQSSVNDSIEALKTKRLHIEYLHAPDHTTPFEETAEAMNQAHDAGKFDRFGLSNYSAKQVDHFCNICEKHGWIKPSVYQGQYNAISRGHEKDLLPVLRKHGISFYAYSPTAAGFFSGKVTMDSVNQKGSRWDTTTVLGKMYVDDYFNETLFQAAADVVKAAENEGISGHAAALRWALYHSALSSEFGDAVIIGTSSPEQLSQNLNHAEDGPLSAALAKEFEEVWLNSKKVAPGDHGSFFEREKKERIEERNCCSD